MLIYLIKQEGLNNFKVGITSNLRQRITTLQTGCPYKLEVLNTFESSYARNIESFLHKNWKDKNTSGEWFCLTEKDQTDFVILCKKFHDNLSEYNKIKDIKF